MMGVYNIIAANTLLYAAYWMHTLFPTNYDWVLLGATVTIIAGLLSDEQLKRLWSMVRWVHRQEKRT
jgi:hypothetical protein